MTDIDFNRIIGSWLHSHEEDVDNGRVYRRDNYAFPPSRGRDGYEFYEDHTGVYIGIAAGDGVSRIGFTWRVPEDARDQVVLIFKGDVKRELTLITLEDDRFVIQRNHQSDCI